MVSLRAFHLWAVVLLACLSGQAAATEPGDFDVRAQLTPRQTTILSSEIAGKVLELPIREGQAFREGQEIVSIDCASYRARLAQAEAQVNRARRRASALRILDGRGATGRADLDIAVIEVEAARAEQQLASIDVSRCSIAAPFSGRVAELKLQRFEYVTAGRPVIEILSDRDLEVELLAPSRWLTWLSPGTTFTVQVDELGRGYPAVVTRIGARIDPVSQSVKVYSRIDGHFPELVPGMSGLALLKPPMDASVRQ